MKKTWRRWPTTKTWVPTKNRSRGCRFNAAVPLCVRSSLLYELRPPVLEHDDTIA